MTNKTRSMMNAQIAKEFYNSNLYMNMAGRFELMNLDGFAKVYRDHSDEERGHGLKFMNFLLDAGFDDTLIDTIPLPTVAKNVCALDLAKLTVDAEVKTTASLQAITEQAVADRDHQAYTLLQWFMTEQVQEEDEARKLVGLLSVDEPTATLLLNQEYLED